MNYKVLLFIENLNQNDATTTALEWVQTLQTAGHTVTLLTAYPTTDEVKVAANINRENLLVSREAYQQLKFRQISCKYLLEQYLATHPQDLLIPLQNKQNLTAALCDTAKVKVIAQTVLEQKQENVSEFNQTIRDWAIQKQRILILPANIDARAFTKNNFNKVTIHTLKDQDINTCVQNLCVNANKNSAISLDKALKMLNQQMQKKATPPVRAEYIRKYFETSFFIIKTAPYERAKKIFTNARRVLKKANINLEYTGQKLYKICLEENKFEVFYAVLHEILNQQ